MFTLLGGPDNRDLLWLAAALRRRREPVEIVLPEEILEDARLTYRIDRAGVSSALRLRDGRWLGVDLPNLVINRLTELPVRAAGSGIDTAYLGEEWRAALAAWLRTLRCPVLNPPRAASLGGPVISIPAWRAIARAHGMACHPWANDGMTGAVDPIDILVVGDACLDASHTASPALRAQLCQMSRFVGAPLLGASFDRDGEWAFIGATVSPPLEEGQALVDAIVQLSKERQKGS